MTEKKAHIWGLNDSILAGAGAGFVASVATCPLDVLKTKLQAQKHVHGSDKYLGIAGILKDILRRDGFKGLYRGLGPTILGYLPTWAIYFTVYDDLKTRFGSAPTAEDSKNNFRIIPAPHPKGYHPDGREHPWTLHLLSAMIAGACSTFATNPLWVIKTRFMTQSAEHPRFRHTLDAARTIYRAEGINAFYRGLLPSLLGIAHVAVQFPLYEELKVIARSHGNSDEPLSNTAILLCSGFSKMTASITTYPHEVIRTRLQIHQRALAQAGHERDHVPGVIQTFRNVISQEGWRGLYRGLSINLIRTVPNSAVTLLTYELTMRSLSRWT